MKKFYFLLAFVVISLFSYGQKFTGLTASASTGTATAAVDNNMGTRWESAFLDPQWITVDLGESKTVGAVKLYWEGANAKDYSISFSTNGTDFTGELFYTGKAAGTRTDLIDNLNVNCRYIKMNGTARNLTYGYSIWEFEVYPPVTPVFTSLTIAPVKSVITLGSTKQLTAVGLDQIGNPIAIPGTTNWTVDGTGASVDGSGLFSSTQKGIYTVTATNGSISNTATVDVIPDKENLSLSGTATASSGIAALAIDNDGGSRWESAFTDPQWIVVDLGTKKTITDIIVSWEAANAKDYTIETSDDNIDWSTRITNANMAGGNRIDRIFDLNIEARYVRISGTARNLTYGYSIFDFQIFGSNGLSTISPEISKNNLTVYQNATIQQLIFSDIASYAALYSLQGQLVISKQNISSLDISSLKKGMYIVRLVNNTGIPYSAKIELR